MGMRWGREVGRKKQLGEIAVVVLQSPSTHLAYAIVHLWLVKYLHVLTDRGTC